MTDTTIARSCAEPGLVLSDPRFTQRIRWRVGERLDDLFHRRCDEITAVAGTRRLAVDAGRHRLTYQELDRTANQLARYLLGLGARPGDRIGLLFDHGVDSYIAMLAVAKMQAAFVPLDPGFPADRLEYILGDAGARMVLTVSSLADLVPAPGAGGAERVALDDCADAISRLSPTRLGAGDHGGPVDDLAYLIYTSGTTGRPKGVAINHASICNFLQVAHEVYGLTDQDRMYQGMTIAFDFSVEEIWVPWMAGATLIPRPPGPSLLGADLHAFLADNRVSALCCVPTLLATLEDDLPDLRFLLVSGEACPRDLVTRWHRDDRRFLNVYGPTEATVTATWTELHPDRPVTIGRPLPTYSVVILDPERAEALPLGTAGEIGIAGIGLAEGYLNRDDLTERAFVHDFVGIPQNPSGRIYRSGDLGRVTEDGEIEYLGRIDTQVKVRGYRIELTEIESVLLEHPAIAQAVVDVHRPEAGLVDLVAYYARRGDVEDVDRADIARWLRDRLPPFMVPAYLEELSVIPMTPSDKADRKALPPPTGPRGLAPREYVAPAGAVEAALAGVLSESLGLDLVSVEADFFLDLGADSLVMSRFAAQVRRLAVTAPISIREIYLNPTVRRLAAALDGRAPVTSASPEPGPRHRASGAAYVATGVAQLAVILTTTYLAALLFRVSIEYVFAATVPGSALVAQFGELYRRSSMVAALLFAAFVVLPIAAKWLLIGRWRAGRIRLWSPAYLRFWLVRTLLQVSPLMLFAGSPLFLWYLRALGAKIGAGAVIHARGMPVATDLITLGDRAVIGKSVVFSGYRAVDGMIETGPITIGAGAHVAEKTVLDVDTAIGDGGELGHSSALQAGQAIPAGQTWHGCPAEPTSASYRSCPEHPGWRWRAAVYTALQLLGILVVAPATLAALVLLLPRIPALPQVFTTGPAVLTEPAFYLVVLAVAVVLFVAGLVGGLAFILTVPRLLAKLITPTRTYPLYGLHHIVQQAVAGMTNSRFFMHLTGDSSAVLHYVRALGYDLDRPTQTGSNFGTELRHDSPYLTRIGTGTMVSDGLSAVNTAYSGTAFTVRPVIIGEDNYLGNDIAYPAGGRTGQNVLLATKVMVPIDGPVWEHCGMLGSPPFRIPRSVERDGRFDHLKEPDTLRRALRGKNRHNTVTAALSVGLGWVRLLIGMLSAAAVLSTYRQYEEFSLMAAAVVGVLVSLVIGILAERLVLRFGRLEPGCYSIYDPRFWHHERHWKLSFTPPFRGTPLNPLLWRLAGVRMGRRVFDDGVAIPEKTLATIGDDATLNVGSVVQCHSLEDGTFKSDHSRVGAGVTLGVHAFVHYGVTLGEGSHLDADAFLMKGGQVAELERWQGNPATLAPAPVAEDPNPGYAMELLRRVRALEGMVEELSARSADSWRRGVLLALLTAATVVGVLASGLANGSPAAMQTAPAAAADAAGGSDETATPPGDTEDDSPEAEFVRDYYAHLPGDPQGAFEMLTPSLQQRSGGLAAYTRTYLRVASVQIVDGPALVNPSRWEATLRIQRRGGAASTERWEFTVVPEPNSFDLLLDIARPVPTVSSTPPTTSRSSDAPPPPTSAPISSRVPPPASSTRIPTPVVPGG